MNKLTQYKENKQTLLKVDYAMGEQNESKHEQTLTQQKENKEIQHKVEG